MSVRESRRVRWVPAIAGTLLFIAGSGLGLYSIFSLDDYHLLGLFTLQAGAWLGAYGFLGWRAKRPR